jgi:hypothetical protein
MATSRNANGLTRGYAVAVLAVALALIAGGCSRSKAKADGSEAESPKGESPKACIRIQQTIPEIVQVDDSGITIEPIRVTIVARGEPDDLKGGEILFIEDGVQKSMIPVGDLHAGTQTVTIPVGLHMTSSSQMFDMSLIRPDGSETPDISLMLNSPNYVPPPERPRPAPVPSSGGPDSDQPIATIAPGVDREEAESILQFGANEVGITSFDGIARQTTGDDANLPPQTFVLQGVNFKDGMLVKFTTTKGGQRVEATSPLTHTQTIATLAKPSGYVPNNPSELMRAVVVVPVKITHGVESAFSVKTARAESSDTCE